MTDEETLQKDLKDIHKYFGPQAIKKKHQITAKLGWVLTVQAPSNHWTPPQTFYGALDVPLGTYQYLPRGRVLKAALEAAAQEEGFRYEPEELIVLFFDVTSE
jgi:hypothetical protein